MKTYELEDYVLSQARNVIAAYVEMLGWSTLQNAVRKKSAMLPAPYKHLICVYEDESLDFFEEVNSDENV